MVGVLVSDDDAVQLGDGQPELPERGVQRGIRYSRIRKSAVESENTNVEFPLLPLASDTMLSDIIFRFS